MFCMKTMHKNTQRKKVAVMLCRFILYQFLNHDSCFAKCKISSQRARIWEIRTVYYAHTAFYNVSLCHVIYVSFC